ncbi:MAG: RAMP superfamily CRISPR-associated protein [Coleofasciculus sp.]
MYKNKQAYGIIETLAPLHVGATAGEESGNLNLIFRDSFTQTGIIPGSSIRGRLRTMMRQIELLEQAETLKNQAQRDSENAETLKNQAQTLQDQAVAEENYWYGHEADSRQTDATTESRIKIEQASIVWLPVFCPGQPIVWVSCPSLLKRYRRIVGQLVPAWQDISIPKPYTAAKGLNAPKSQHKKDKGKKVLFFNLGFLTLDHEVDLSAWFPPNLYCWSDRDESSIPAVVVDDKDIGMIHDMALYRQSRVALEKTEKKASQGAFFNTEALPEGTILVFPIAIKPTPKPWTPFNTDSLSGDIYLGGLESIGFGHCQLTIHQED